MRNHLIISAGESVLIFLSNTLSFLYALTALTTEPWVGRNWGLHITLFHHEQRLCNRCTC